MGAQPMQHYDSNEQVIGLGKGSWLDLWDKNIMYDMCSAFCPSTPFVFGSPCEFDGSLPLAWHRPASYKLKSKSCACSTFGGKSAAIAGSVFFLASRCVAQVLRKRYYHAVGIVAFGSPCDVDGSTFCVHVSAPPPEGDWPGA